jgi:hypothetical protein
VRLRLLQAVLAVLVGVAIVSNLRKPKGVEPPPTRPLPSHAGVRAPSPAGAAATTQLRRNIFQYGERVAPPSLVVRTPAPVTTVRPADPPPTPAPVKLVGIVQGAGGLRAALTMDGEVVLGSRGEKVRGYTIVTIDEDRGVVLSGPDGEKLELRPADTP